jgi:hypothetical protein
MYNDIVDRRNTSIFRNKQFKKSRGLLGPEVGGHVVIQNIKFAS